MQEHICSISRLISKIGSLEFCRSFLNVVDEVFGVDQCCAFVSDGELPRRIVAETLDCRSLTQLRHAAQSYMQRGHQEDPIWECNPEEAFVSNELRADRWEKPGHRAASRGSVLSLSGATGGICIHVVLIRSEERPGFDTASRALANLWGAMILSILQKHSEVAPVLPVALRPGSRVPHDEMLARVRHAIKVENAQLSPREIEICASIVLGYTMTGISLNLGISVNTVATHRKHAYAKLGVSSQNELFARYLTHVESQMPRVRFS